MTHFERMQKQVDAMPLSEWLDTIKWCVNSYPNAKNEYMKEFVRGMAVRDLVYHWDDCALDCLAGKVTEAQGNLINEIVEQFHCEEMFTLAMESIDPVAVPALSKQIEEPILVKGEANVPMFVDTEQKHNCHCCIKDLATWGCKCGGK